MKRVVIIFAILALSQIARGADEFSVETIEGVSVVYTKIYSGNGNYELAVGYYWNRDYYCAISKTTEGIITIPDAVSYQGTSYKVTKIYNNAFKDCNKLTSVIIPNGVTSIGYQAFSGCTSLTEMTIPHSVTYLGSSVFEGCTLLRNVIFSDQLNAINSSSFKNCTSLQSLNLPQSINRIDENAFEGCTALTSIVIPNDVNDIPEKCFLNCTGLQSVKLPQNVSTIGKSAFEGCTCLTEVVMPHTVSMTDFNSDIFKDCAALSTLTIPNGITSATISGLEALTSINFPESLKTLSIYSCPLLHALNLSKSLQKLYLNGCSSLSCLDVPNSVLNLELHGCKNITELHLKEGITSLKIFGCILLKEIDLPCSLNTATFYNCLALEEVTLPEGITSLSHENFHNCQSLRKVTIPESVTAINSKPFSECPALTQIYCRLQEPLAVWYRAFEDVSSQAYLYVPFKKSALFKSANYWKDFKIVESKMTVGDNFTAETNLGDKKIADVKYIITNLNPLEVEIGYKNHDESAFSENLSGNIQIPTSFLDANDLVYTITGIGKKAFLNTDISSIVLPSSIKYIAKDAFLGCTNLSDIEIPQNVENIESAFINCQSIKNVTVNWRNPSSVLIADGNFSLISDEATLYVPAGTKERYDIDESWRMFSRIVESSPVYIDDISTHNSSKTTLSVNMNNSGVILGIQFEVKLPEGISIVNNDGNLAFFTTERTKGMTIMGRKNPDEDNSYLFVLFSPEGSSIKGTEGAIVNFEINVAAGVDIGKYNMLIDNIFITSSTFETIAPSSVISDIVINNIFKGDINNDGNITAKDASLVLQLVAKKVTPETEGVTYGAADVNDDGQVTAKDASMILQYVAKKITW